VIGEDRTRRLTVAGIILSAHALVVCALLFARPHAEQRRFDQPVQVRFVESTRPVPKWSPPEVRSLVTPHIAVPVPETPIVETPVLADSQQAITTPVQVAAAKSSTAENDTPKLISTVEYVREPVPRYPPQSRKLREQGLVVLRVLIDEKGAACSIEVETSSGHERLDHAAREAVSRAAFRPYVEDGFPRRAFVLIPIEFSLNRSAA
jgi:protein TonB